MRFRWNYSTSGYRLCAIRGSNCATLTLLPSSLGILAVRLTGSYEQSGGNYSGGNEKKQSKGKRGVSSVC